MEAYLLGNILFRDWQDENRYGKINENLEISDPTKVQSAIKKLLFDLIKTNAIRSYHRKATSGDMNPNDYVDESARKLSLEVDKFLQVVNNRGNWENQQQMIKETISKDELKNLVRERIQQALEGKKSVPTEDDIEDWNSWHPENPVKTAADLLKAKRTPKKKKRKNQGMVAVKGDHESYADWVKSLNVNLSQRREREKKNIQAGVEYYNIGFSGNYVCWYWDAKLRKLVTAVGHSHKENFGDILPYKNFRGRYDMKTKELSLTVPEGLGSMKLSGKVETDVPAELRRALDAKFPGHILHYFPYLV